MRDTAAAAAAAAALCLPTEQKMRNGELMVAQSHIESAHSRLVRRVKCNVTRVTCDVRSNYSAVAGHDTQETKC